MLPEINLGPASNAQLPNLPNPVIDNTGTQFGNVSPVSGLTITEEMFLDPLEKRYTANKRKTDNPTRRI